MNTMQNENAVQQQPAEKQPEPAFVSALNRIHLEMRSIQASFADTMHLCNNKHNNDTDGDKEQPLSDNGDNSSSSFSTESKENESSSKTRSSSNGASNEIDSSSNGDNSSSSSSTESKENESSVMTGSSSNNASKEIDSSSNGDNSSSSSSTASKENDSTSNTTDSTSNNTAFVSALNRIHLEMRSVPASFADSMHLCNSKHNNDTVGDEEQPLSDSTNNSTEIDGSIEDNTDDKQEDDQQPYADENKINEVFANNIDDHKLPEIGKNIGNLFVKNYDNNTENEGEDDLHRNGNIDREQYPPQHPWLPNSKTVIKWTVWLIVAAFLARLTFMIFGIQDKVQTFEEFVKQKNKAYDKVMDTQSYYVEDLLGAQADLKDNIEAVEEASSNHSEHHIGEIAEIKHSIVEVKDEFQRFMVESQMYIVELQEKNNEIQNGMADMQQKMTSDIGSIRKEVYDARKKFDEVKLSLHSIEYNIKNLKDCGFFARVFGLCEN